MSQPVTEHSDQPVMPVAAPVPPPPPPAPLRARNLRLAALLLGCIVLLYVVYVTLPVVVAHHLDGAYPAVRAVITGARDGQTVREGQSVTFSARQSTGRHLTYSWNFGDGATANGAVVVKSFAQFHPHLQVTLTIDDPLATTTATQHRAQARIAIRVMPPLPVARFTATVNALLVGTNSFAINFDAGGSTGEGITTYAWDCGDGATYAGGNPRLTHFYTQTGTFMVTLTVTDGAGQTASLRQAVLVTSGTTA